MKRLLSLAFVALLLLSLVALRSTLAQTIEPFNAVHFSNAPHGTSKIFWNNNGGSPGTGTTFFMSFWYNMNQRPTAGQELFSAMDANGTKIVDVVFVGNPTSPDIEVDGFDSASGECFHVNTGDDPADPATTNIPYDGKWHNVILSLWVEPSTSDGVNRMHAQIALDGTVHTMDESDVFTFGAFNWAKVQTWTLGGSYAGDLAEVFLDLEEITGPGGISGVLVNEFLVFNGGAPAAPGLGDDCTNVSGFPSNMCHRGQPCDFLQGIRIGSTITYFLRPSSANLLSSADSEPCRFLNDGGGTDGYIPGTGCPLMSHP